MSNSAEFINSIAVESSMEVLEGHWDRLMVEMREPMDGLTMRDKQDALRCVLDRIASVSAAEAVMPVFEHYKLPEALMQDYAAMDEESGRLRMHLMGKQLLNGAPDNSTVTKKLMALTAAMGKIEDDKAAHFQEIAADAIQKHNAIMESERKERIAQDVAIEAARIERLKPVEVQPVGDWSD